MRKKLYSIEHSIFIDAPPEVVWHHIIEVDIASFEHPVYFSLLDIPKPLRAEVIKPGVGGKRTAFFSNNITFSQNITVWQPNKHYAFTFHASPNFRVAYLLNLSDGPFQMKAGAYHLTPNKDGVHLSLSSNYQLRGLAGLCLSLPVRLVLHVFQKYLLNGIKANAERQ